MERRDEDRYDGVRVRKVRYEGGCEDGYEGSMRMVTTVWE